MDPLFITIAVVVVATLFLVTKSYLSRKNLPPTIFPTLPIIGHLHLMNKPLYRTYAELTNKHGPILLLSFGSRRVLLLADPKLTEECFTKQNDIIFANRPNLLFGKILGDNFTNMAWSPYGEHFLNLRKISSTEFFSSHRINEFYNVRAQEGKIMLTSLASKCSTSSEVNLSSVINDFATNNLMMSVSGKRFSGEDEALGKQFQEIVKETFELGLSTNLADYIPFMRRFGSTKELEKKMHACVEKRDTFFHALIDQVRQGKGVLTDKWITMIGVFLKLQQQDPQHYTDDLITAVLLNILAAGIEKCTSITVWALALMLNNPHVLKKAHEEIDNIVGTDRLVEESDLSKLPYLRCIVNETMRLYPAVPTLLPHENSEDCVVGGYHIPKGAMLMVNQWAVQHDPKLWSDPQSFKPERFEGPESTTPPKLKYMPFGSGVRMCPGYGLGIPLIGLGLSLLIQCFDFERIGKDLVDMTEGGGLVMIKGQPLIAKCTPRPKTQKLISQA
uniref:cytochrome P450 81Q32-like n=1 Tax=Erigeron canadensis TaxID=72917 RepID=UPI001CB88EE1|nr:cytochrome P450 81Q32-like [Erigeron canadensis]